MLKELPYWLQLMTPRKRNGRISQATRKFMNLYPVPLSTVLSFFSSHCYNHCVRQVIGVASVYTCGN